MSYSAGIQHFRIPFAARDASTSSRFGLDASGISWTIFGTFWASVTWRKGIKDLREGALDAYDFILVRMDYHPSVTRECILQYDGTWYQIESCHRDYEANTIQITAREMPNQPTPAPAPTSDSE